MGRIRDLVLLKLYLYALDKITGVKSCRTPLNALDKVTDINREFSYLLLVALGIQLDYP